MNDLSRRGTRRRGNSKATGDGKRFVVPADEKLAAFVELERAIRETLRKVYAVGDLSRMNSIGVKK
jgi:phosphoserine phosphatase